MAQVHALRARALFALGRKLDETKEALAKACMMEPTHSSHKEWKERLESWKKSEYNKTLVTLSQMNTQQVLYHYICITLCTNWMNPMPGYVALTQHSELLLDYQLPAVPPSVLDTSRRLLDAQRQ